MAPKDIAFLRSEIGRELLSLARETRGEPAHKRPERLRARAERRLTRAGEAGHAARLALQQDDLRVRAAERLGELAEVLLLAPEALEQATALAVADERAARWPGPADVPLTDLTAGLGLDALAAARTGRRVRAVERDPLRAELLRHNAAALAVTTLEVIEGDAADVAPDGGFAFLDPDRRATGRRTRDASTFAPPVESWRTMLDGYRAAMIKLPPGEPVEPFAETPFEVVSLGGRARETRLLLGDWSTPPPRAALALPSGRRAAGTGRAWPDAVAVDAGTWLLDPDVSVVLAGLVGDVAHELSLAPVHPRIAYLAGAAPRGEPPGTWMRVSRVLPARAGPIDAWLREAGIGNLTIRTRGVDETVAAWRRRLHPQGPAAGTLVITRDRGDRWVAYGCADPEHGAE